jgi:hypothetical protein
MVIVGPLPVETSELDVSPANGAVQKHATLNRVTNAKPR